MHNANSGWKAARQPSRQVTRLVLAIFAMGAAGVVARAQPPGPPDAVIEVWEQSWKLNADGSTVYHEKQHVRLNHDRAYGEFADPRITYRVDTDELKILTAHVRLPGGAYVELPDYAHVLVTPDATSGWPAFANIRQHLLVMSGIEPGCVVELEYEIASKPGTRRYLAGDIRLDHRYAVQQRKVSVAVPANVTVAAGFAGFASDQAPPKPAEATISGDLRQLTWTLPAMPAVPEEPQSVPWPARCRRFAFSTAGTLDRWVRTDLDAIDAAATESDLMARLAAEWTKDRTEPADKLRALQEKLAGSFNFIEFDASWRPAQPRPAGEVLRSNYGLPEEAAAVFLSLARAAGVTVRLGVLCNDDVFVNTAPQRSMVAAWVLLFDGPGNPEIWDAHRGRLHRDARWAGHTLFAPAAGKLEQLALPPWSDADESRCRIGGNVSLKADGNYGGSFTLRLSGLFVSPESLRSTDGQKARLGALLGRILPEVSIESFTVKTLGPGEFDVTAQVRSSKPLKKLGGRHCLLLAQDGPFLADVPLPLAYSDRTNPVRLAGAFDEQIELTVEWPAGWRLEAQPVEISATVGDTGAVTQSVRTGENRLMLSRHTRIAQRDVAARKFLELREPLNVLRTDAARTLLLAPAP